MPEQLKIFVRLVSQRRTVIDGLKVSVVVGSVLNAINHGAVVLHGQWEELVFWKLGLNYLVPFCVSVYATTRARSSNSAS